MIKKIIGWLTGTSKTVLEFIGPILQRSVADILSKVLPIALEVVESLATDDEKTGAQKRLATIWNVISLQLLITIMRPKLRN
jgi:hypothetical protein